METGIYEHYKGGQFLVLGFGFLEENVESAVIYQHLSEEYTVWIRSQKVFEEALSLTEPLYNGPRFRFIRKWTPEDASNHPLAMIPFSRLSRKV